MFFLVFLVILNTMKNNVRHKGPKLEGLKKRIIDIVGWRDPWESIPEVDLGLSGRIGSSPQNTTPNKISRRIGYLEPDSRFLAVCGASKAHSRKSDKTMATNAESKTA